MSEASDPHIVHHNVVLLRVADPVDLERALQDAKLRALIWHRLDEHRALVNPEGVEALRRALRAQGLRPFFSQRLDEASGPGGQP